MTKRSFNQAGFEVVGVLIAILAVAIIGFAGYKVLNMNKSATEQSQTSSQTKAADTIKTQADLTQTGKTLDESGGQMDSSLDDGSLDSDLNSML